MILYDHISKYYMCIILYVDRYTVSMSGVTKRQLYFRKLPISGHWSGLQGKKEEAGEGNDVEGALLFCLLGHHRAVDDEWFGSVSKPIVPL